MVVLMVEAMQMAKRPWIEAIIGCIIGRVVVSCLVVCPGPV